MNLELVSLIATTTSFFITIPLAALARTRRTTHALLTRAAFSIGYSLLAIIFVADAIWEQPLPDTPRFARGLGAGIAVGLVVSGCVLYAYDVVSRTRVQQHTDSKV
jgi:hypothetical protein